jgi:hypothetical protein
VCAAGEAPITWDEVAEDEDDLANEEYDQPILIGVRHPEPRRFSIPRFASSRSFLCQADPFEQEYNDNDYYERLEDPLGSKPATKCV